MSERLTLATILDDAALLSFEHQLHLADVLGDHSWSFDGDRGQMVFSGARDITCAEVHLLGTAAPGPRSWMWGWANPSGFPEPLTALSATVRDFGQRHGIAGLAEAEVPFDAVPGSPDDPRQVAMVLADAAKVVTGRWSSYSGDAGGGTMVAFLVEHPDFRLPAPEPIRVMRVIQQGIADLSLTDHRRALYGYAHHRRLSAVFGPDHALLTITGPGLNLQVDFDGDGRAAEIRGSLSPTK